MFVAELVEPEEAAAVGEYCNKRGSVEGKGTGHLSSLPVRSLPLSLLYLLLEPSLRMCQLVVKGRETDLGLGHIL